MVQRKCAKCGEIIVIMYDNIDSIIIHNKLYYHEHCFDELCAEKIENSRTAKRWTAIYKDKQNLQQATKESVLTSLKKEDIFQWMCDNYPVSMINSTVYQKLEGIYNGRWKGQAYPIGPAELLDEWKWCMEYLVEARRDKKLTGNDAIKYDLSILLNQNAEYREMLRRKKIEEKTHITETKNNEIDKEAFAIMQKNSQRITKNNRKSELFKEVIGE